MAPLVGFDIEFRWETAVGFRWDDRCNCAVIQSRSQPVGIEGPVGQKVVGGETVDQVRHPAQIMRLAGQQPEINRIAERIRQRQDLGRDAATRAPYGLALSPPLAP